MDYTSIPREEDTIDIIEHSETPKATCSSVWLGKTIFLTLPPSREYDHI